MARSSLDQLIAGAVLSYVLTDIVQNADGFNRLSELMWLAIENRCGTCGYKNNHPIVNHEEHHEALRAKHGTGHGSKVRMHRKPMGSNIQHKREPLPLGQR